MRLSTAEITKCLKETAFHESGHAAVLLPFKEVDITFWRIGRLKVPKDVFRSRRNMSDIFDVETGMVRFACESSELEFAARFAGDAATKNSILTRSSTSPAAARSGYDFACAYEHVVSQAEKLDIAVREDRMIETVDACYERVRVLFGQALFQDATSCLSEYMQDRMIERKPDIPGRMIEYLRQEGLLTMRHLLSMRSSIRKLKLFPLVKKCLRRKG